MTSLKNRSAFTSADTETDSHNDYQHLLGRKGKQVYLGPANASSIGWSLPQRESHFQIEGI
jgi:hypothetical protein